MATAKQLVPGIHMLGKTMIWEGKIGRVLTIEASQEIADKVCDIPNIVDKIEAIRAEIIRVTGIPAGMLKI